MSIKSQIKTYLPWVITLIALYVTFKDIDWSVMALHIGESQPIFLIGAAVLTSLSYLFRTRRWMSLFPECKMDFFNAYAVLVLGFFYNNVLPARAGEFVRAHLGAQISGQSRALVLATVLSERIIDGLTISLLFVVFSFGVGDAQIAKNLFYVALGFAGISVSVILLIALRKWLSKLTDKLLKVRRSARLEFILNKLHEVLEGLSPLSSLDRLPILAGWSLFIWFNELLVFILTTRAYGVQMMPLSNAVFMLVAVNFSSLIPSAPGGIGIIEAVGTAGLVSLGLPKELSLVMILTQHIIQYIMVGIPGAFLTITWKKNVKSAKYPNI